jgi:hypothetical protein
MPSKYNNKKTVVNGHVFDSKAEADRYGALLMMAAEGKIWDLELQPRFLLQDGFMCRMKKHRPIEYVADFKYRDQYKVVVEDVKGMQTDVYKLKLKMLLKLYGDQFVFCEFTRGKKIYH